MFSLGIPEGAEFAVLFCSNVAVFVIKLLAYFHTGSAAMLSEAIHSLVDALNQVRYQLEVALFLGLPLSLFFGLHLVIQYTQKGRAAKNREGLGTQTDTTNFLNPLHTCVQARASHVKQPGRYHHLTWE